MEQFRLKSIEEFDTDFVSMLNKKNAVQAESEPVQDSVIPELVADEPAENSYFKKTATDFNVEPEFDPAPQEEVVKTPRPLVPIGQNNAYSPVGAPAEPISEEDFGEPDDENPAKEKSSAGALVGRIISIILLTATIVVFVLGCFVTVFLDNGGSDIGGYTVNTISADVVELTGENILSKGDLVIAKKVEPNEYVSGAMIAVPSAYEEGRCDVHIVNSVNSYYSENAEISTTDITSPNSNLASVMAADCFGVVSSYYIPVLGGLLHFAMENVILVCVLFVLLAALWCLILVLIENKKPKKNR